MGRHPMPGALTAAQRQARRRERRAARCAQAAARLQAWREALERIATIADGEAREIALAALDIAA